MTLAEKISAIVAEMQSVPKTGKNGHFQYQYHTESDVLNAIRSKLIHHRILVRPSQTDYLIPESDGSVVYVGIEISYINLDNVEDKYFQRWGAMAKDPQGRGIGKAFTTAYKQALAKMFMLSDNIDNDSEEEEEEKPATYIHSPVTTIPQQESQLLPLTKEEPTATTQTTPPGSSANKPQRPFKPVYLQGIMKAQVEKDPGRNVGATEEEIDTLRSVLFDYVFVSFEHPQRWVDLLLFAFFGVRDIQNLTSGMINTLFRWLGFNKETGEIDIKKETSQEIELCGKEWGIY